MYRLSLIISEIYNKYLPLAEKDGIILNLDFSDTTKEIADPDRVKKYLDEHLDSTLKRSDKGEVTIGVDKTAITITDSGTTLSHSACALLSNRYIDVSSRVGFGTTIKIFLQPREAPAKPVEAPQPLKVEGVAFAATADNSAKASTVQSEVKVAAQKGKRKIGLGAKLHFKGKKGAATKTTQQESLPSKTSQPHKAAAKKASAKSVAQKPKTSRQLAAAARKADREVKRIAKKAQKIQKTQKTSSKKTAKVAKASTTKSKPKVKQKRKIVLS